MQFLNIQPAHWLALDCLANHAAFRQMMKEIRF